MLELDSRFNVISLDNGELRFHGFDGLASNIYVVPGCGSAVFIKNHNTDNGPGPRGPFILECGMSDNVELIDILKKSLGYHFLFNDGVYYQSHISVNA